MSVLILMQTLSGCAPSVKEAAAPLTRSLPPPPLSMQPVPMPALTPGQDVRVSRYDHRVALAKANKRLRDSRNWYVGVRNDYAGQK